MLVMTGTTPASFSPYPFSGFPPPQWGGAFCISKTPGSAGGSKELIAISLENKTPFDYTKIAAANCNESQKEVITK